MKLLPTDWTVETHAHNRRLVQIEGTVKEQGESHRRVLFYGFDNDVMAKLVCAAPKMAEALEQLLEAAEHLDGEPGMVISAERLDAARAALKEAGR